jgi:hypothetical protein
MMADIILEITIPDQYVNRVVEAFNWADGQTFKVQSEEGTTVEILIEKGGLNNRDYGKKVLKLLGKSIVRCYELSVDRTRYINEVGNVQSQNETVPDVII